MPLTIRTLLTVSRPISWFNTVFVYAAGAAAAGSSLKEPRNLAALVYFALPYNLALYGINDICDYPSDKLNPRKNSVEGGLLPPETHRPVLAWIAALNAPFLPFLAAHGDRRANGILAFLFTTTIAYSAPPLRLKEVPGLDSLTSAAHYVTPLVYGLALNRAKHYPGREIVAFVAWCMASQSFGAIQDIEFDRAGGFASIATSLGARRTAQLATALYLLAILLALTGRIAPRSKQIAGALALLPYLANTTLFLRDPRPERANPHWRTFIKLNLLTGAVYTNLFIWGRTRWKPRTKLQR